MKHQFLKSALILGSVLAIVNCSEDAQNAINNLDPDAVVQPTENSSSSTTGNLSAVAETDSCWLFSAGQDLLIYPIGIVTDASGNIVGTFENGVIKASNGTDIAKDIDLNNLTATTRQALNAHKPTSSATVNNQTSSANTQTATSSETSNQPGVSSATVQNPTSSNTVSQNSSESKQTESSSSQEQQQQQPNSSSATSSNQCDGKCLDKASGECVKPNTTLKGPHDEQYAYDESCKLNCYYDPTNKNCQDMTGAAPASSATQQQSSNSNAKSSSSQQQQQKSSSSQQQQQPKSSSSQGSANASAEEAQYLNAGAGGQQGWATRYWDCCMPHCAQPAHGGTARTCSANGGKTKIDNNSNKNVCQEGGQGATCTSQIPIIVSDKLAYAFAATPGNDNTCGKCFALTFTGQGKYETKTNHEKLKGKTLVVMASNIGYDVAGGQFDVMIPGGGFGAFNGCSQMGWKIPQNTETYGGFLSDCEKEAGWDGDTYSKRKECLTNKCNEAFANDTEAKEGCLFLATWMEAAGNPLHTYKEVPCPEALKQRY